MKIYKKAFTISTLTKDQFREITDEVRHILKESGIQEGLVTVYSTHTTGGICINENQDPDVLKDLTLGLNKAFPDDPRFLHMEGNAQAHLKAINITNSATLILDKGHMEMGIWQGIFFCEFDGPRERKILVQVMGE